MEDFRLSSAPMESRQLEFESDRGPVPHGARRPARESVINACNYVPDHDGPVLVIVDVRWQIVEQVGVQMHFERKTPLMRGFCYVPINRPQGRVSEALPLENPVADHMVDVRSAVGIERVSTQIGGSRFGAPAAHPTGTKDWAAWID